MRNTNRSTPRRRKKRLRGLAALTLCLCLLSGCAQQASTPTLSLPVSTPTPEPSPEPTVATSQAPSMTSGEVTMGMVVGTDAAVHPLTCIYTDLVSLNSLVFESLVELDDTLAPAPMLADRWSVNGSTWTFTLRSGIVFHNGAALTANDVVASYNYILSNGADGAYYDRVQAIDSMTAVDDLTLEVEAADSTGYLLLYAMTFPVVQASTLDSALPMGTGPYWYIGYDTGVALRLERNPFWWKQAPKIGSIVARNYASSELALSALDTGEINTLASRSKSVALSRTLSSRNTLDYPTMTYECIVPNLTNSALSNTDVRRAIMYAIDRTTLASTVYLNMVLESEVPVIPGSWTYETQTTRYNYSPERALQLLNESGWFDSDGDGILDKIQDGLVTDLSFTIITYDEPETATRTDAANLIADQLALVGIRAEVEVMSKAEVRKALNNGSFDLALVAFNLSESPDLTYLLGSNGDGNCSGYSSETMDSLLRTSRRATTADEVQSALSKIQLLTIEDLPVMGLFFRSGMVISTFNLNGLHGIRESQTLRGIESWDLSQ